MHAERRPHRRAVTRQRAGSGSPAVGKEGEPRSYPLHFGTVYLCDQYGFDEAGLDLESSQRPLVELEHNSIVAAHDQQRRRANGREMRPGKVRASAKGPPARVLALAFADGGRTLRSATADGRVGTWQLLTGEGHLTMQRPDESTLPAVLARSARSATRRAG